MKKSNVFYSLFVALTVMAAFSFASPASSLEDWEKKYNIIKPEEGTYPVTVYSNEVAPLPHWVLPSDVAWVNSHTLIYKVRVPNIPYESQQTVPLIPIVTLNLRDGEKKEVGRTVYTDFCFDSYSQNIAYAVGGKIDEGGSFTEQSWVYGQLAGERNKITVPREKGHQPPFFVNPYDCSFVYPYDQKNPKYLVDGFWMGSLRQEDGFLGRPQGSIANEEGEYQYLSPEGEKKRFSFGTKGRFHFDAVRGEYWVGNTHKDRTMTIRRYDRRMNLLSEKRYPKGPWGTSWPNPSPQGVARDGYLFYKTTLQQKNYLYLLTFDGRIIEVLRDYGFKGNLSVSPDGCKAVFIHQDEFNNGPDKKQELAVVKLC